MEAQKKCKQCGKPVADGEAGSQSFPDGREWVRCRPCTRKMLKGAKPVGDGFLRVT